MSSSTPDALVAVVLTISDSCAHGERQDLSGPAVAEFLRDRDYVVEGTEILPDETDQIRRAMLRWAGRVPIIVTTGGTGIGPRDFTPEATRAVCDRILDGIGERMRLEGSKKTPFAALSRAVCGVCRTTLVLNLPGSPSGAVESLASVVDLLPHALQLLSGDTQHEPK
jgi:molybdopterin adenylyltransferase